MQLNPKRRRLNDASSALSKPFKSPLRRQPTTDVSSDTTQGPEPEQIVSDSKSRSTTASSPLITVPLAQPDKTPLKSPLTPKRNLNTIADSSPIASSPPSSSAAAAALITSLRKQESALLSRLITLRRDLDTVSQALKIEQTGQDDELRELIEKWRGVSREAAEELFVGARDKVNRMGGVGVWKERIRSARMSRMEWDTVEESGWDDGENDEDGEDKEVIEDEREKRRREIEDEIRAGEADDDGREREEESDEDEETFTMDMMLKSLSIDLDAIGYDKTNQRWVD